MDILYMCHTFVREKWLGAVDEGKDTFPKLKQDFWGIAVLGIFPYPVRANAGFHKKTDSRSLPFVSHVSLSLSGNSREEEKHDLGAIPGCQIRCARDGVPTSFSQTLECGSVCDTAWQRAGLQAAERGSVGTGAWSREQQNCQTSQAWQEQKPCLHLCWKL